MSIDAVNLAVALSSTSLGPISPEDITILKNPEGKDAIADASIKVLVKPSHHQAFMIVSGDGNRHLVRRGVENIVRARSVVQKGTCSAAILPPIVSGEIDGRAFAVWERHRPLPSGRGSRLLMRWTIASRILDWAHDLCADSLRPADDVIKQFQEPLEAVSANEAFPSDMRRRAEEAISRIGFWQPVQCIEHGDFWEGNVLRPARGGRKEIFVIDWAGANIAGYPVTDITRMLMSLGCSSRVKEHYYARLCSTLACVRSDLVSYALASIGHLGANLEHFPPDRYHALGVKIFDYLKK